MALSPKDIARIQEDVERVVRSLHAAHLSRGEGTLERFLAYFDDDVIGIGTGPDEVVFNKKELHTLLLREWSETPESLPYDLKSVDVRVLSALSASAQSFVDIYLGEVGGPSIAARLTTVFRLVDGRWKSAHWHASTPWEIQPEGVSWPAEQLEAKALKLEQEVAARTEELSRANRELEVEAALERIRSRTMAMQSSEELGRVSILLDQEVRKLGPKTWGCAFNIYGEEDSTEWFGSEAGVQNPYRTPREKYFKEFYDRGQAGNSLYIKEFPEGECAEHYDYMKTLPVLGDMLRGIEAAGHSFPDSQIDHVAYFRYGYLLFITLEPAPEMHDVFQRFASVFEQSYTRFLDLKNAEAQAREAQIEAALERIRGRALAMRSSMELDDVADEIRHQMGQLGQKELELAVIHIYDTGTEFLESWGALPDPAKGFEIVKAPTRLFPKKGIAIMEEAIAAYESDQTLHELINEGEKARDFFGNMKMFAPEHYAVLSKLVPEGMTLEDGKAWWTFADFDGGSLGIVTYQPASEKSKDLLVRTAKVFDLAYRRFKDLRESEEAQREAQIEAALERVRAQAMGMRNSDELLEVVATIHREYSGLGLACGVFWHARYHPDHYEKALTAVDGSRVSTLIILPRDFSAVPELAAWERGTEPFGVFKFDANAGCQYMQHMINKGHLLEADPNGVTPDDVRKNRGLTFVQARTTSGEIGYSLWGETDPEPEAEAILTRFAKVFDLAHRRFEDLQESEMAAREARIESALERVRARTMAMHSSEELKEVALSYGDQLEELGMDIHGAMYLLQDPTTRSWTLWTAYANRYPIERLRGATLEFPFDEVEADPSIAAWRRGDSFSETFVPPDKLRKWTEDFRIVLDASGQSADEWIALNPEGYHRVDAYMKYGVVAAGGARAFTPEEIQIQIRFAREFERTYQRFLGLKQAEAQARESKIEASLERVRGQAMAMQKPEDIGTTCHTLFEEIRALCPEVLRLGLGILNDEHHLQPWMVGRDPSGEPKIFEGRRLPRGEREEIDALFDAWLHKRTHWFRESRDFLEWANTIYSEAVTQGVIPIDDERDQFFSAFTHQTGFLYVIAYDPFGLDREEGRIINRFGGVFDLAYQRYNDLKQAEIDYQALLAEKARTEKALADLQATQQQLIEQEKLASLGSLTAGIAHEIKNPLNFVNNFAEVSTELMQELAEAVARGDTEEVSVVLEDLRDNAEQIAKHGKRADSIVRSMMQHARGGASERESIEVNHFLEEYANLAWHGMRARDHGFQAEVKRDFDPSVGSLLVMPQELGRVVLNLLNNAFDAVKGTPEAQVTIKTERTEGGVTISVADNGPGVPEAVRPRIFEPFFTTKATGEGTGLGLSLSYDIVTKGHGGTMTVGQSPDGGALFTIMIPSAS